MNRGNIFYVKIYRQDQTMNAELYAEMTWSARCPHSPHTPMFRWPFSRTPQKIRVISSELSPPKRCRSPHARFTANGV